MFLLCKDFKRGKFREFVPAPIFFPGILPNKCGNLSTVFNFHYHCCFVIFIHLVVYCVAPNFCLDMWTCCRQIVSICPKDRGRERETQRRDREREARRAVLKREATLFQLHVQLVKLAETMPHDPWPHFASQLQLLTLAHA